MTTHLGIGAMLQMLGGNRDSVAAYQAAQGKRIASVEMVDDRLRFVFDDDTRLTLSDEGQSCCESRYMRTDDDLTKFAGAALISVELRDVTSAENDECNDEHEMQFMIVTTSIGAFTCCSHNEHNGYYGGICIRASAS